MSPVAVIDQGEIIERGPVWQVYSDPQHETTRQLLNPQFGARRRPSSRADAATSGRGLAFAGPAALQRAGAQPDLAAISAQVSGELTLLYSAVEWVDRKPTGQLLLLLDARHDAPAALTVLHPLADQLEVAGYVTGY